MRQNLFWAFAYNTLGIALAAAGWLNPAWPPVAMVASSSLVIANSLRLAIESAPSRSVTSRQTRAIATSTLHRAFGFEKSVCEFTPVESCP